MDKVKFNYLLDNLLVVLYDSNEIDKDNLKKLIYERLMIRSDPQLKTTEYLKKLKSGIDNFFPVLGSTIGDIIRENMGNTETNKNERYLTGGELSNILGITKGNITILRGKGKYFSNTIQTGGKGGKLQIPFADIEKYVNENKKYLNLWLNYLKER